MNHLLQASIILLLSIPAFSNAEPIDFSHQVLPLLKTHCAKCHTNGNYKGGLSMDSRAALLESETVVVGKSGESELIERIKTDDLDLRMPKSDKPEAGLKPAEVAILTRWVNEGLPWEEGFSFRQKTYQPPLEPRRPELPAAVEDRQNPVDRVVDAYYAENEISVPESIDDARFLRRVTLDLTGRLPNQTALDVFVASKSTSKRERAIQLLLAEPVGYADHWMSFWNDLLRNDYQGTGFIDGGRKQITEWLYESLLTNKPYDQFVRELINPADDASAGFIKGIQWRGRVNASQVRELQFAQNVSQVMLGINLKCASCHDSFINDWKLTDAYGMAAIISDRELEIHRCDQPIGEFAKPAFVFPELGTISAGQSKEKRLAELAKLMTSEQNGRLTRTIVNRLWDRLMGRGIVHPVDIMSNRPWSEDLIDYLAADLSDHGYDLKRTIRLIVASQTYQSSTVSADPNVPDEEYRFRGPVAKRMTAEQFQDSVWQLTGGGPAKTVAKVGFRGGRKVPASLTASNMLTRALGRPNREQVVTTRPAELTTLQALDLTNGDVLAKELERASKKLLTSLKRNGKANDVSAIVQDLYRSALSREPNEAELQASKALLIGETEEDAGESETKVAKNVTDVTAESLADLYWSVLMLPEFQMVR